MPPTPVRRSALSLLLLAAAFALSLVAGPLAAQTARALAQAQEMVDAGKAQQAIPLLDTLLKREPGNAHAYLLRSTARFLIDDIDGGKKDLDKALQLDPGQ